jgi:hypothetical protein
MLSFAADFWPLFWTINGAAALLTVVLSVLIATFSPTWFQPHRRHRLTLVGPAAPAGWRDGHAYQAGRGAKAA